MIKLKINRYIQDPSHCAVAACASAANFYNNEINYEKTKEIAKNKVQKKLEEGLDSGEIGRLLNNLGFYKVTLITTNLTIFDYSWVNYKRKRLIETLHDACPKMNSEVKNDAKSIYKWLKNSYFDNNIIIDYNFGKYIRNFLNKCKPIVICFNWNMFFKFPKLKNKTPDCIKGNTDDHAIVIYGYHKKGVLVCDSHNEYYKYRLKRFKNGFYSMSWENLMTVIGGATGGGGDIFLPEDYNKELVQFNK